MEDTSRWVYDEEASEAEHRDVVHEIVMHDRSEHVAAWVQAMRQLNSIEDPLARKILACTVTAKVALAAATPASLRTARARGSHGLARRLR